MRIVEGGVPDAVGLNNTPRLSRRTGAKRPPVGAVWALPNETFGMETVFISSL